jgi:hypothetical protein
LEPPEFPESNVFGPIEDVDDFFEVLGGTNEMETMRWILINDFPRLTISEASAEEGDEGETTFLVFKVTLKGQANKAVVVAWETKDDTATAGEDYQKQSGELTFQVGEKEKLIRIPIHGDNVEEEIEKMEITLYNPENAIIEKDKGIGYIIDDDGED